MTDRHINISITIPVTQPDSLADITRLTGEITDLLNENGQYPENVSVHEFDLDEADDEATVYLVLGASGGSGFVWARDADDAGAVAKHIGGVAVELPVLTDHRGEVTA